MHRGASGRGNHCQQAWAWAGKPAIKGSSTARAQVMHEGHTLLASW